MWGWINSRLRRWAQSKPGTYVVLILAPFLARPSDFRNRVAHWAFGRMSAVPIAAVLPAADIWSRAMKSFSSFNMRYVDYGAVQISEAIKISQQAVLWNTMGAFASAFIWIHIIAGARWVWHTLVRAVTNRWRKDGETASEAPWNFFVYHTTGWMLWASALLWMLGTVNALYGTRTGALEGNLVSAYWDMAFFIMNRTWLWLVFAAAISAMIFLVFWSNGEILVEIYRTDAWALRIRAFSWCAAPICMIFISMALEWALLHLLQWSTTTIP